MNQNLTTVDFHGAKLIAVPGDRPETTLVAMKPIVEGMGLDWGGQHKKILAHPVLKTCISVKEMQMPGDDQNREHTFLSLEMMNFWLATIHPDRIKNQAVRARVIEYQTECARVLFDHFFGKVTAKAAPKPKRERKPAFDAAYRRFMNVAALLPNLDDNQRALMAARGTFNLTGINPLEVMGHVSLPAPNNETHYTPTQIGEKIGTTGRVVNVLLIERGYQCKDDGSASGSSYVPTEKGKPFARFFDTTRRNGSGSQQQLKWSEKIIPHLSTR